MKISVIIPCYNCSDTIQKCIQSVIDQRYPVKEIICIDDGSTDNTLKILKMIETNFTENISISVLRQENSGPSVARNKGIDFAKGDWIAFLDADDYWLADKIQRYVTFINDFKDARLVGSIDMNRPYVDVSFNKLLFKNYFKTSAVLVHKDCLSMYKFDTKKRYSEDYKLWLEIIYEFKGYLLSPQTAFSIDFEKDNQGYYLGNGLSSKVWQMQKGELSNYYDFYKKKKINGFKLLLISSYSTSKFVKRLIEVKIKKFSISK